MCHDFGCVIPLDGMSLIARHVGYLLIVNMRTTKIFGLMGLMIGEIYHRKLINMNHQFNILMLEKSFQLGKKFNYRQQCRTSIYY